MSDLNQSISLKNIEKWLRETNLEKLKILWKTADSIRLKYVGDEIHLRGLLEISNNCARKCAYCGINKDQKITRYRMTADEIMYGVNIIVGLGYGTLVLQAGEDYGLSREFIAQIIRRVKTTTPLAVTLSLGERTSEDLKEWKNAGANRYLLRFETSDKKLYSLIHPGLYAGESPNQRFNILKQLRNLGYEIGSGVMVGIPGQTYQSLAKDIVQFRELDLDMIGIGPYIYNPHTALGINSLHLDAGINQVPSTDLMTYKTIALARLVCPEANIPSTTALAAINNISGYHMGLSRGANVLMPNATPITYRINYKIYPNKARANNSLQANSTYWHDCIKTLKRKIGKGMGSRKNN